MTTIPTLTALYNGVLSDLQTQFGDSIPLIGKIFLRAVAGVQAGRLKIYYLFLASVQKNIAPDTADPESMGGTLERWARIKGIIQFPAAAGQYILAVSGSAGATIAANTTYKSDDDSTNPGMLFILDSNYVLTGSGDMITVRALEAGLDSQMLVGEGMTATSPIANVNQGASVTAESLSPLAAEDIETFRARVVQAYRTEPQGGAPADYRLWAADAQGVRQSYNYSKTNAPAEVNVFVEATLVDSTDGKGTPSLTILNDVSAVIEFDPDTTKPLSSRGRRPTSDIPNVLAVTIMELDIIINGFVGLTPQIQTDITNALKDALFDVRPFVAGADVLADKNDFFSVYSIVSIILSTYPGSIFSTIILNVNGSPVPSITFVNGNIPDLNSVTFM